MFCAVCGREVEGEFCPGCGAKGGQPTPVPPVPPPPLPVLGAPAYAVPYTDVGARVGAYLIDVIPAVIVTVAIGWIPILGAILLGFILSAYWLLRDINGASIGKMVMGLVVVKRNGAPSQTQDRILRNVTLAAGPLLLIIPLAGYAIAPPIAGILSLTEAVMLLVKHERLGDTLAGTTVVKKTL